MNIPSIKCKIEMFCSVNPSEDSQKIINTISNIFPLSNIEFQNFSVVASSRDLRSFEKIYEAIHNKRSQKTYRKYLEKNYENSSTWFYLNKQAAYVGKIAICEQDEESPLGPIKVVISSPDLDRIIEWIAFGND
ncbi:MAG: hypothetical protein HKM23_01010 [Nitrosopumilus sp.]|nr:hypothetical protein [Nitrosopumilus sp.]NND85914.1 hypothetical protein [Nitrosopumilus sp.]NNL53079.1 hypothetical protein [Nitrosopumilus sp.]NNL58615.1 hypothetical protein [Nitrosopumilus sp.]